MVECKSSKLTFCKQIRKRDSMIRFAVCDDEKEFRTRVVKAIDKIFMKNTIEYEIEEFIGYDNKFEEFMEQSYTSKIYILDIELKNSISGIDIARKIRKSDWDSIIIMVTSHFDLGYEALKAQIMLLDFISKYDECEKRLTAVLKKAISNIDHKKILIFETNGISHRIYLDDILYVTKDTVERKCIIRTTYTEFAVNKTMNQMIEELDDRFYLTHRSCLVNTEKIRTIDWKNNIIYFEKDESIDLLARDKKKGLKEFVSVD